MFLNNYENVSLLLNYKSRTQNSVWTFQLLCWELVKWWSVESDMFNWCIWCTNSLTLLPLLGNIFSMFFYLNDFMTSVPTFVFTESHDGHKCTQWCQELFPLDVHGIKCGVLLYVSCSYQCVGVAACKNSLRLDALVMLINYN